MNKIAVRLPVIDTSCAYQEKEISLGLLQLIERETAHDDATQKTGWRSARLHLRGQEPFTIQLSMPGYDFLKELEKRDAPLVKLSTDLGFIFVNPKAAIVSEQILDSALKLPMSILLNNAAFDHKTRLTIDGEKTRDVYGLRGDIERKLRPANGLKIMLAITPTDVLVMSEDLVVPSLLKRINKLYPALDLTMGFYNAHLKGLGRQPLCDKIEDLCPTRVAKGELDVNLIYEGRDAACMDIYARFGTKMAREAIESLNDIIDMGVGLSLVSNNSVQRGTCAILCADNKRGEELMRMFKSRFYETQSFQAQDPKETVGTALERLCRHEGVSRKNTIVFCRASNIEAFRKAGFESIIGSVVGSKTPGKDREKLRANGACAVVGSLPDLPAAVTQVMHERILMPRAPEALLAKDLSSLSAQRVTHG